MSTRISDSSDERLLQLLSEGSMSVLEVAAAMEVTATAVRQRLARLMGQGLVERDLAKAGRGRPSHRYSLSEKARRQAGTNFADLALVLWDELRAIKDPEVRKGLLTRIASSLASKYAGQVRGGTTAERMQSVADLFADRGIPLKPEAAGELAILTVNDCPYPELAEQDRGICAVEKMLFTQLLDEDVRLSQCRLEGHSCCQFQTN